MCYDLIVYIFLLPFIWSNEAWWDNEFDYPFSSLFMYIHASSLTFMSRLKSFAVHFRSQPFLDFADDNNFVGELEFV